MQSNFDKNFESQKVSFKSKFNKEWNLEPQLYLTYLQTLYIADAYEISSKGFQAIVSRSDENNKLIQSLNRQLAERK
jgi:hypothetical protein